MPHTGTNSDKHLRIWEHDPVNHKYLFLHFKTFLLVYRYTGTCECMHDICVWGYIPWHMCGWRSEDNFLESVLSFCIFMHSGDPPQCLQQITLTELSCHPSELHISRTVPKATLLVSFLLGELINLKGRRCYFASWLQCIQLRIASCLGAYEEAECLTGDQHATTSEAKFLTWYWKENKKTNGKGMIFILPCQLSGFIAIVCIS